MMAASFPRRALAAMKSLVGLGGEGSWRGPFYGSGEWGGVFQLGPLEDGWQRNLHVDATTARLVPAVHACIMAIARSIAQCYPKHVREIEGGKTEEVRNSAAYRVLRNPNTYQTTPGFLLNLIATTLTEGEAFVVATRNARTEVDSLHLLPPGTCVPRIDDESKEVFYAVGSSPLAPGGTDFIAPARDILHLRFYTPRHPLIGETPIRAAALAIGVNVSLSRGQAAFFNNMSRPSGVLSTDSPLNKEQMLQLRSAFDEQSRGMAAGKIPILSNGLKFQSLSISSQDAQLVQAQQMSLEDICRVFGVPPPLVGDLNHATLNNSETLIQHFMSMSLGSYLEHLDRAFDRLFQLGDKEYIELDATALLRTNFLTRIEGLTKAVQGGLFAPNEARMREGLGPIDGGDAAFLQRQMVPIAKIGDLLEAEAARASARAQPPAPTAPANDAAKDFDPVVARALLLDMVQKKKAVLA
jgi:HK97 family phage portal protein